jgi:hypothetical protein
MVDAVVPHEAMHAASAAEKGIGGMSISGTNVTGYYWAWNTSSNTFVTGDKANHTLNLIYDGSSQSITIGTSGANITDCGGGLYGISTSHAGSNSNTGTMMIIEGTSSTSNVVLIGIGWNNLPANGMPETTKTAYLPSATAGAAGGVFIAGSNAATTFASVTITSGTIPADIQTIKTQSVTCAAGVTVLASIGTASTSTAQSGDAYSQLNSLIAHAFTYDANNLPKVDVADILGTASQGAAGYVGIDWSKITSATSTVAFTGTTVATVTNVIGSVDCSDSFVLSLLSGTPANAADCGVYQTSVAGGGQRFRNNAASQSISYNGTKWQIGGGAETWLSQATGPFGITGAYTAQTSGAVAYLTPYNPVLAMLPANFSTGWINSGGTVNANVTEIGGGAAGVTTNSAGNPAIAATLGIGDNYDIRVGNLGLLANGFVVTGNATTPNSAGTQKALAGTYLPGSVLINGNLSFFNSATMVRFYIDASGYPRFKAYSPYDTTGNAIVAASQFVSLAWIEGTGLSSDWTTQGTATGSITSIQPVTNPANVVAVGGSSSSVINTSGVYSVIATVPSGFAADAYAGLTALGIEVAGDSRFAGSFVWCGDALEWNGTGSSIISPPNPTTNAWLMVSQDGTVVITLSDASPWGSCVWSVTGGGTVTLTLAPQMPSVDPSGSPAGTAAIAAAGLSASGIATAVWSFVIAGSLTAGKALAWLYDWFYGTRQRNYAAGTISTTHADSTVTTQTVTQTGSDTTITGPGS